MNFEKKAVKTSIYLFWWESFLQKDGSIITGRETITLPFYLTVKFTCLISVHLTEISHLVMVWMILCPSQVGYQKSFLQLKG